MKPGLIRFAKWFAWSLLLMILITYALGWMDLVNNNMLTGNWLTDFTKSISYYTGWVAPYWWLMNLICAFVLSCIFAIISFVITKFRGAN